MYEVEAKVPLAGSDWDEAILETLGATGGQESLQEDLFFLHPTRDFATTDEALRVRREGTHWELTYKGPRVAQETKVRREINHRLEQDPTPMLEALGFKPGPRLRKVRRSWRFGAVTVALDDVDGVGRFVEVETMSDAPEAAAELVEAACRRLGLPPQREGRSYLELLTNGL